MKLIIFIISVILMASCTSSVTTKPSYTPKNIERQASIVLQATGVNIINDTRHNHTKEGDIAMMHQAFVQEFAKYENKFESKYNLTISNVNIYFSAKLSFWKNMSTAVASFFFPPISAVRSRETFPLTLEYDILQASGEKWSSRKLTTDISGYYTGWYIGRADSGKALIKKEVEFAGQEAARMLLNDIYANLLPATEASTSNAVNLLQRPRETLPVIGENTVNASNSITDTIDIPGKSQLSSPKNESSESPVYRLKTAKDLYDQGLISKEDYEEKKRSIMDEL